MVKLDGARTPPQENTSEGKKNREPKSGLKKEIQLLKWQSPKSRLYGIITTPFLSNVRKIEKIVTCYFGSVCHHNRNGWRYIHFYTASSSSMSLFLVLLLHLSVWCVEPTAGFLQPFLLVEQCTAKIFKNKNMNRAQYCSFLWVLKKWY